MDVTRPRLLRVEVRLAGSEPHPALAPRDGDDWQQWTPPPDGWNGLTDVRRRHIDDGIEQLTVEVAEADVYIRVVFETHEGERFWGFGERSNAADQAGALVEHWVGEGPYQIAEYPLIEAITPQWAIRRRRDATYYPIPWLLSSRGYGVLADSPEWSCHDLTDNKTWSIIARTSRLRLRVFTGELPADALRRFTNATGRQPLPAAPWFLGPWVQTGHANLVPLAEERAILDALEAADAPVSAVETHMRRLPGGAHVDLRADERARSTEFHSRGLGSLTYLSPTVSTDFARVFGPAAIAGAFESDQDSKPYTFTAYMGGREPPVSVQAQLDFSAGPGCDVFGRLVDELIEDGHDGWMEDFGEYTPIDSTAADGLSGARGHNLYPLRYHRAAAAIAASRGLSPARFVRSGWTGSAAFSPLVWGGDPTTGWGFDGLRSAVIEGLTMGLSGVAFWGSDIGGFFSLGDERLTQELLIRWIQFGALSPLMRTKAGGIAAGPTRRPQVWDEDVLPHWRRWASFHTRLSPYLMLAAAEYTRTGIPLMRHHALTDPTDGSLTGLEDQYLLGPDLLVAPALEPGMRERTVRLPAGDWVDLWRSVAVGGDGEIATLDPVILVGGRTHVVPAPLNEIPVLVRWGAEIKLLPASVRSLYGPVPNEFEILGWRSDG